MFSSGLLVVLISSFFVATVVYFSKKQTELLTRLNRIEKTDSDMEKMFHKYVHEMRRLKKTIVSIRKKGANQTQKNHHAISEQTVKELLLDLEDEGVLKKSETREAKDIIIIQEFVHHSGHEHAHHESEDIAVILDEARELVKTTGIAAAHLLQSQLRIPQELAENILDRLEEEGIVGPPDGSSHRNVFIRE